MPEEKEKAKITQATRYMIQTIKCPI